MKLENKVILPFVIFVISFLIIELIFFNFFSLTKDNYNKILNTDTRFNNHENILNLFDLNREVAFVNYRKIPEEETLETYNRYKEKSYELFKLLIDETSNDVLKKNYIRRYELWTEIIGIEEKIIDGQITEVYLNTEKYKQLKREYQESRDFPAEFYQINVKEDMEDNINKASVYGYIMLVALIFILLLVVMEFVIIHKDVVKPMRKLSTGLSDIGEGKFPILDYEKDDQMKDLIQSFNQATLNLLKSQKSTGPKPKDKASSRKMKEMHAEIKYLQNMVKLASVINSNQKEEIKDLKRRMK